MDSSEPLYSIQNEGEGPEEEVELVMDKGKADYADLIISTSEHESTN